MENYICNKGYKNTRYKDLQRSGDWVIQTSPPPSPHPTPHTLLSGKKSRPPKESIVPYTLFSVICCLVFTVVFWNERGREEKRP